jgi:hypothetical protein
MSYLTRNGAPTPRAVSAIGGGLLNLFHTREGILLHLHNRLQKNRAEYQRAFHEAMRKADAARAVGTAAYHNIWGRR